MTVISKFLRRLTSAPGPDETIAMARSLHQQGRLDDAAALYQEILRAHPGSAEAHYRYANLRKDLGDLDGALAEYDEALARRADHAHALCNRAVVLGLLKRVPEAIASYDRALAVDPRDVIALCNRSMLQAGLGQKDAALAGFDQAISHDAQCFPALFGRGALLQERRDWPGALHAYDRAATVNPGDPLTHYNRGTVQKALKQWAAAAASYERALALNDAFALAHAGRGEVLQELNDHAAALTSYERALALDPAMPATHNNHAVLLQKMGRFEAALAAYDAAIAADPSYADAWYNRGTVLKDLGRPDAALESYERSIALRPNNAAAHLNRGFTQQSLGRVIEAVASYKQAVGIDPELPEAHYNLALARLTLGEYTLGWRAYEWRWRATGGSIFREKRDFEEPLWLGDESVAGKTVLLYGEQGLGDSLQFCRYAGDVAQLGARVILEVPAPLKNLCARLNGVARVVACGDPLPDFDCQTPLMSLPLAFKTTLQTIPAAQGYLTADPDAVAAWRDRLGPKTKPRIGLAWSGRQTAGTNRNRHFSLASLIPHLPNNVDYFCVQTDITPADAQTLAVTPMILPLADRLHDFGDTAALCACMDLIVTVDTSVAHLSGALGRRTWVLLAAVADWRWLLGRDDSPWYTSMRLFRQPSPGDWHSVFARVAAELRREFAG